MCAFLRSMMRSVRVGCAAVVALWGSGLWASTLDDIRFSVLPGERFEVRMSFSEAPAEPASYTIEQPARVVLDFPGVENGLAQKKFPLSFDNAKSAMVLAAGDRTRLILNLNELTSYQSRLEGSEFVVEVGSAQAGDYLEAASTLVGTVSTEKQKEAVAITNIDFRRGEEGEGKVIFTLSSSNVDVDVEQVAGGVAAGFSGVWLPLELRRELDVVDFATPVTIVSADYDGSESQIIVSAQGEYDYLAYQADNEYVISVKALSDEEQEERKSRFAFVGEKLSLNFQDIEVRSVLQLIADFTELNLVASDTVSGRITLRLDGVPWDQALDLVLKTKGLGKRQVGNVLMVAPAAEIAERERQELETNRQLEELAPVRTEYIRIRYANATELFALFGGEGGGSDETSTGSILSERGRAIVDERTNSIILTDTDEKIEQFKALVEKIDIPIRQVLIEARIVIANTDFRKEMGVRWMVQNQSLAKGNNHLHRGASSLDAYTADNFSIEDVPVDLDGDGLFDVDNNGDPIEVSTELWAPSIDDVTLVDLGLAQAAGSFAWLLETDNGLLGMELSALEDSGHAEIVSQPKVITGDKQLATIESGTEIPYQEASSSGATTTAFREAVLKLEVTPQITPDDRIIMDLEINQDSIGEINLVSGIPVIDVTQIQTQVLVGNGQTVVLGGIYQTEEIKGVTKVPFLGDVPYVGRLFRQDVKSQSKKELLIFITPKILAETLAN